MHVKRIFDQFFDQRNIAFVDFFVKVELKIFFAVEEFVNIHLHQIEVGEFPQKVADIKADTSNHVDTEMIVVFNHVTVRIKRRIFRFFDGFDDGLGFEFQKEKV